MSARRRVRNVRLREALLAIVGRNVGARSFTKGDGSMMDRGLAIARAAYRLGFDEGLRRAEAVGGGLDPTVSPGASPLREEAWPEESKSGVHPRGGRPEKPIPYRLTERGAA